VALDLDEVVVNVDLGLSPGGELVRRLGQGPQRRTVDLGEDTGTRALELLSGL
jgi:hypothetical protein